MQANIPVQAIKCCILCGNTKLRMTFSDLGLGHLQSWNDKKNFNPKLFWPGDVDCSIRFNMVKVFIGFIKRQKQKKININWLLNVVSRTKTQPGLLWLKKHTTNRVVHRIFQNKYEQKELETVN